MEALLLHKSRSEAGFYVGDRVEDEVFVIANVTDT